MHYVWFKNKHVNLNAFFFFRIGKNTKKHSVPQNIKYTSTRKVVLHTYPSPAYFTEVKVK